MRHLEVVAVSDDGTQVLLASAENAARPTHAIRIDSRLQAALRGELDQDVERRESELSPKEIQARLRAGETEEQVARAAKVPVSRVMRYAGPVISERERIVDQARAAVVQRLRGPEMTTPLGELMDKRLAVTVGLRADTVVWSARRRDDGAWIVSLSYHARGGARAATWLWLPGERELTPDNTQAARMSVDDPPASARRRSARFSAAVTTAPRARAKPPAKAASAATRAGSTRAGSTRAGSPAKSPVTTAAQKSVARTAAAKKAVAVAKKTVAKKAVVKKTVAKKTVAKKTVSKKNVAIKAGAKKAVAIKLAARTSSPAKPLAKSTARKGVLAKPAPTRTPLTSAARTAAAAAASRSVVTPIRPGIAAAAVARPSRRARSIVPAVDLEPSAADRAAAERSVSRSGQPAKAAPRPRAVRPPAPRQPVPRKSAAAKAPVEVEAAAKRKGGRVAVPSWSDVLLGVQAPAATRGRRRS